ncbi:MAG TPA: ATP-binding protein [Candidatus Acidoferrales bacterium]|nr:ATP-binding protein [Candidatus Acidoferrales bacterium]
MHLMSNPALLAVAFVEASAATTLLVVFSLLANDFPTRVFRYWLTGWTLYVALEDLRVFFLWRGGSDSQAIELTLSMLAATFFLAGIIECVSRNKHLKYLWSWGLLGTAVVVLLYTLGKTPIAAWSESSLEFALYVAAGWILWRSQERHRGFGWKLLAATLILRGLHTADRPDWAFQSFGIFRTAFQGVLGVSIGVNMAVLILEAARTRTDDLNEKLRRLAVITAASTQSPRVQECLEGVLQHVIESLGASQGIVFLFEGPGDAAPLITKASIGFGERALKLCARLPAAEPWVKRVLQQETPFISYGDSGDLSLNRWTEAERLEALLLVSIPGKESPLGILGIGSSTERVFQSDESRFVINVANLLGLTVQNVTLFEHAAASRKQWLDTFDSIDDLILVHSLEGKIVRANRALAERVGFEPSALIGRYVRDVLRQGTTGWRRCPYCEGIAGRAEETDPSFGGYFLATDSAFHDSSGVRLGTIHVLKDFTSRKQAEDKYRMLFEKGHEGVFISTPHGALVDFNDSFMRILGYENHDELCRVPASDIYVDVADRDRLKRLLHEYGEVTDFEFQFRRRDGEIRTAQESSFVTRDPSGSIVAYQGFLLDITEQKRAEMDIRQRNRELLALNAIAEVLGNSAQLEDGLRGALLKVNELFSADASAVFFLDENTLLLKLFASAGYLSHEPHKSPAIELSATLVQQMRDVRATIISGSANALPEAFRQLQREEGIQTSQFVVLWSKGRMMGALVVGSRQQRQFSTAELNLLAAVANQIATTIDKSLLLNETREAYETLRLTQEQLLQSEKMVAVGQLISGVAHELNNPLTAILGYSQLLKSDEFTTPRGADYVGKLYKQAMRTHRIVQNLLSVARQHKPERTQAHLNQILDDTVALREYDMKVNNIRVHRDFDPKLPVTGADPHQLQQVFLNILNNAFDAIQENGRGGDVWIRTSTSAGRICVEITDSGSGVKNPHKIFDPFYTTKPVGKGTGLGLSICYGIVKEHAGEILVKNSPPRGATFTIHLPVSQPSSAAAEPPLRVAEAATGKLLLVDDEEDVLQLEREILISHGLSAKIAHSAAEAIEILKRGPVDAVVADMKMPGELSTLDLYCWIGKHRPELSTHVAFTASDPSSGKIAEQLKTSGCTILTKPFRIEEFWHAVQKLLSAEIEAPTRS